MSTSRRLTVIGAGYVGLATAIGLASRGHEVEVVEVRRDRLESLSAGILPIHEPGMDAAFADPAVRSRIHPVSEPGTDPDLILVCVGTPLQEGGRSDLSQLQGALAAVKPFAARGVPVVIRSTLPPGSLGQIVRWANGDRSRLFVNPEFLRQGTALEDFLNPTRVVIGAYPERDEAALASVADLLAVEGAPLIVVGVTEAELLKNGANAFLALKLSFTNEMAVLCEELGADVGEVIEGIGLDPRIGRRYMEPSYGFGGSCLPKELRALANIGRDLGVEMHVTSAAAEANEAHQRRFARKILQLAEPGATVGLLGLAFKAGTDDVRYSPALRVAQLLLDRGITVVGYDPEASANARVALRELIVVDTAAEALDGASIAVIATEWPEFRDLDWDALGDRMASRTVVDGRRLLDPALMRRLGFRYVRLGSAAESFGGAAAAEPALVEAGTARS